LERLFDISNSCFNDSFETPVWSHAMPKPARQSTDAHNAGPATPNDASESANATRTRLLEAAGTVFSARGFRAATVREICDCAKANVAAVNYHFGDKERFYAEALRYWAKMSIEQSQPPTATNPHADARERLAAVVRGTLNSLSDGGRCSFHGKLMAQELFDPTPALDIIVSEFIRPKFNNLCQIVRSIVGPDATEDAVRRCAASVIGQCLFYRHSHAIIERLLPGHELSPDRVEPLTEHIVQFSYQAMLALRDQAPAAARPAEKSKNAKIARRKP